MYKKIFELVGVLSLIFILFLGFLFLPDFLKFPGSLSSAVTPVDDNSVLDILSIVMAFIGVAGYSVYLWIFRQINEDMNARNIAERSYITAMTHTVLGQVYTTLYKSLYNSATVSSDKESAAKKQITHAIAEVEASMREFLNIDAEIYSFENLILKNNHAYFLALKWNYYREGKNDSDFCAFLTAGDFAKEYLTDKKMAEQCILFIDSAAQISDSKKQRRLFSHVEDTRNWVEKIFSAMPDMELGK